MKNSHSDMSCSGKQKTWRLLCPLLCMMREEKTNERKQHRTTIQRPALAIESIKPCYMRKRKTTAKKKKGKGVCP